MPKTSVTSISVLHLSISKYVANDSAGVPIVFNIPADSITINPLTTGIAKTNTDFGITIYPNPNTGTFTITTKENNYTLIITTVLGKNIYQSEIKNQKSEIDISKQPNGVYFINIKTEKGTVSRKLIINK